MNAAIPPSSKASKSKRLLFIAGGAAQSQGVLAARGLGYEVIVVDSSPNAPAFALADETAVVDIADGNEVATFARAAGIDGVTTVACESALPAVGRVVDELQLPGMGALQTRVVTNALFVRSAWRAAGIPGPEFAPCATVERARESAGAMGLPVVIKPIDNAHGCAGRRVDRLADIDAAFVETAARSPSGCVLVEQVVDGPEVSFEAFADGTEIRPVAVSLKRRLAAPNSMDVEVDFPPPLPAAEVERVVSVGTRAARVLRVENTPVHVDLVLTPAGPVPVALAARGAGSGVYTTILPLLTGVDLVTHQIKLAMGDAPPLPEFVDPRRRPAVVLRYFGADRAGSLAGLDTNPAAALDGVVAITPYKSVGDPIARPANLGHVIATGANLRAARDIACRAASAVRVEVV